MTRQPAAAPAPAGRAGGPTQPGEQATLLQAVMHAVAWCAYITLPGLGWSLRSLAKKHAR